VPAKGGLFTTVPVHNSCAPAGTSEVWQFLSPWSDMYDLEDDGSFLRAVGTGLGTAKFNVKRFAGDIANEIEAGHLACPWLPSSCSADLHCSRSAP
jgi:hypothetical protein